MFQVPFLLFHGSGLYIPIWLQTMGWEEKTSTLLPVNEKPESKDEPVHSPQQRASGCITSTWAVLAHLVILGSWVSIAVWVSRRGGLSGPHNLNRPYSPARVAVVYETQIQDIGDAPKGPYAGQPNDSLDLEWAKLLGNGNARLSDEEFDRIGSPEETAIRLPDGGYLGSLTVFHQLHCKHLRMCLYEKRYFPPLTDSQQQDRQIHLDHYLEVLRVGVMCNGDITPLTMRWDPRMSKPLANFTAAAHSCVDWGSLNAWAAERQIPNLLQPGYLRHPVLGEVFGKAYNPLETLIGVIHEKPEGNVTGHGLGARG